MFAREGAGVMLTDLLECEGEAVGQGICCEGGQVNFLRHDVSDEGEWSAVIKGTLDAFGRIDVLVNNAGVSGSDPKLPSVEVWNRQMNINARGVFLGMRAVVPVRQGAGGESIVNTSSISGGVGQDFVPMGYKAAKRAVRLASKAVAVQFAKDGIRVNSVHSGHMPLMRISMMTADSSIRVRILAA